MRGRGVSGRGVSGRGVRGRGEARGSVIITVDQEYGGVYIVD